METKNDSPELQTSLDKSSNKKITILSNYESFLLINEEASENQSKPESNTLRVQFDNEILVSGLIDDPSNARLSEGNQIKDDFYNQNHMQETPRKSLRERCCSEITKGSFRSALISVCIFSLGAVIQSISVKFSKVGLFIGWGILITACFINYITMYILLKLSTVYKINSYPSLVRRILGIKAAKILDILVIINNLGALTVYFVIIYKLLGSIIYDALGEEGTLDDFLKNSFWGTQQTKIIVIYSFAIVFIILLLVFKEIHKIRIPSFFGFFAVIICLFILIGQSYFYIKNYWEKIYDEKDSSTWMNLYNIETGFDSDFFFFRTFCTIFFGFNYHVGIIPVCSTLKKSAFRAKDKILKRSLLSYTLIYFLFGTIGFLTCPVKTPDLIILRYKLFSVDWLINIGRALLVISLLMKFPINFNSFKISIYSLYTEQPESQIKHDTLFVFLTVGFCSTLAAFYMNIQTYFDILGGVCAINITTIFPCIMYFRTNRHSKLHYKNLTMLAIMFTLSFIGYFSTIITISQAIKN